MSEKQEITLVESKRLIELEKVIKAGKSAFVEVGVALCEIRQSRLYRCEFSTFEDYCRQKWGFTRQYANQIIAGAGAVKDLPEGLETMVSNERQARELAKAPAEDRPAALKVAQERAQAEERQMTAADVRDAVDAVSEPEEKAHIRTAAEIAADLAEESPEDESEVLFSFHPLDFENDLRATMIRIRTQSDPEKVGVFLGTALAFVSELKDHKTNLRMKGIVK